MWVKESSCSTYISLVVLLNQPRNTLTLTSLQPNLSAWPRYLKMLSLASSLLIDCVCLRVCVCVCVGGGGTSQMLLVQQQSVAC